MFIRWFVWYVLHIYSRSHFFALIFGISIEIWCARPLRYNSKFKSISLLELFIDRLHTRKKRKKGWRINSINTQKNWKKYWNAIARPKKEWKNANYVPWMKLKFPQSKRSEEANVYAMQCNAIHAQAHTGNIIWIHTMHNF